MTSLASPGHVVLYARRRHRVHSRALTVTLTTPCNLKMLHYVSAALSIVSFFIDLHSANSIKLARIYGRPSLHVSLTRM